LRTLGPVIGQTIRILIGAAKHWQMVVNLEARLKTVLDAH